jgi:hypothetical protein
MVVGTPAALLVMDPRTYELVQAIPFGAGGASGGGGGGDNFGRDNSGGGGAGDGVRRCRLTVTKPMQKAPMV